MLLETAASQSAPSMSESSEGAEYPNILFHMMLPGPALNESKQEVRALLEEELPGAVVVSHDDGHVWKLGETMAMIQDKLKTPVLELLKANPRCRPLTELAVHLVKHGICGTYTSCISKAHDGFGFDVATMRERWCSIDGNCSPDDIIAASLTALRDIGVFLLDSVEAGEWQPLVHILPWFNKAVERAAVVLVARLADLSHVASANHADFMAVASQPIMKSIFHRAKEAATALVQLMQMRCGHTFVGDAGYNKSPASLSVLLFLRKLMAAIGQQKYPWLETRVIPHANPSLSISKLKDDPAFRDLFGAGFKSRAEREEWTQRMSLLTKGLLHSCIFSAKQLLKVAKHTHRVSDFVDAVPDATPVPMPQYLLMRQSFSRVDTGGQLLVTVAASESAQRVSEELGKELQALLSHLGDWYSSVLRKFMAAHEEDAGDTGMPPRDVLRALEALDREKQERALEARIRSEQSGGGSGRGDQVGPGASADAEEGGLSMDGAPASSGSDPTEQLRGQVVTEAEKDVARQAGRGLEGSVMAGLGSVGSSVLGAGRKAQEMRDRAKQLHAKWDESASDLEAFTQKAKAQAEEARERASRAMEKEALVSRAKMLSSSSTSASASDDDFDESDGFIPDEFTTESGNGRGHGAGNGSGGGGEVEGEGSGEGESGVTEERSTVERARSMQSMWGLDDEDEDADGMHFKQVASQADDADAGLLRFRSRRGASDEGVLQQAGPGDEETDAADALAREAESYEYSPDEEDESDDDDEEDAEAAAVVSGSDAEPQAEAATEESEPETAAEPEADTDAAQQQGSDATAATPEPEAEASGTPPVAEADAANGDGEALVPPTYSNTDQVMDVVSDVAAAQTQTQTAAPGAATMAPAPASAPVPTPAPAPTSSEMQAAPTAQGPAPSAAGEPDAATPAPATDASAASAEPVAAGAEADASSADADALVVSFGAGAEASDAAMAPPDSDILSWGASVGGDEGSGSADAEDEEEKEPQVPAALPSTTDVDIADADLGAIEAMEGEIAGQLADDK